MKIQVRLINGEGRLAWLVRLPNGGIGAGNIYRTQHNASCWSAEEALDIMKRADELGIEVQQVIRSGR